MTSSKAKGTTAERLLSEYLTGRGWPYAERRALAGSNDKGDVAGTPGLVWESKAAARITLPEWMRETERERVNAGADYGILVVKPRGFGLARIGDWPAIVRLEDMTEILAKLGYGEGVTV